MMGLRFNEVKSRPLPAENRFCLAFRLSNLNNNALFYSIKANA